VTEGMEVHKDQIVRGVLRNVNKNLKRIHISVGPYMGIITFRELSNMFCDAPEYMFKKGKEYDFYVTEVDTNRNNLLYLSRRTFLPLPPQSVTIGEMVHAKVCRFNPENMLIIAEVEEFGGAEAVIHASDLAGCKIRNKTRYPKIGFNFKAHVESVSKLPSGEINRIKLNRGV
jgi:ribosomal protein S1